MRKAYIEESYRKTRIGIFNGLNVPSFYTSLIPHSITIIIIISTVPA